MGLDPKQVLFWWYKKKKKNRSPNRGKQRPLIASSLKEWMLTHS